MNLFSMFFSKVLILQFQNAKIRFFRNIEPKINVKKEEKKKILHKIYEKVKPRIHSEKYGLYILSLARWGVVVKLQAKKCSFCSNSQIAG